MIIGGALRPTERQDWEREIWERVVELAGGDSAKIAVFPTASGTPRRQRATRRRRLEKAGADAFVVPLGLMNVDVDFRKVVVDEEIVEKVRKLHGRVLHRRRSKAHHQGPAHRRRQEHAALGRGLGSL